MSDRLRRAVEGRVVLVTGASSGIGRAGAVRLAAAGASVALLARRRELLEELREAIADGGGTVSAHPCDLSDQAAVEEAVSHILDRHGAVDVLVNNAGHSIRRSVEDSLERPSDFERLMRVNYLAPVRLTQLVLPGMLERGDGHVVNVSSIAVQVGAPRYSAYAASKAALDAFTRSAAAELRSRGVSFTTINMPLVRTPMIEPSPELGSLPSLSAQRAASLICDAVVHRPERLATPIGDFTAAAHAVSPGMTGRLARLTARSVRGGVPGKNLAGFVATRLLRR